jgi:hypothetical protein
MFTGAAGEVDWDRVDRGMEKLFKNTSIWVDVRS